ncbi:eCIS core domain-containing protein [Deinococcus arcticus]|uniref:eCIS core domain-containing protein n=1 Tax=Deinococcus arcticus TaxID=2136176 RepID=UPI001E5C9E2F|nr:DUF4157 domain-containing protein [Deinococcus arcticus]
MLRALELERAEVSRLELQRQAATEQLGALSPAAIRPIQPQAAPLPTRPQTPGEWVTVMRCRAEQVEGKALDTRQYAQFTALQRRVAQTLAQGFRADQGPAQVRYETYGEYLATLQRHEGSASVCRAVLGMVPPSERLALQRALDTAAQRLTVQAQQTDLLAHRQTLQRQLAELDAEATQPVLQRIQARRGSGNPLPEAIQRHLEQGLNHDLSRVRIHDDAEANTLAKSVNAIAFTTGTDIFFQSGRFNPNTQSGLELLAHEVTHTVQQARGLVGPGVDPDAGLEAEARKMGQRLSLWPPVPHQSQALARPARLTPVSGAGRLQRKAADPTTNLLAAVKAVQQQVDSGQIDAAVRRVQTLPQAQRDTVIGVLAALKLPNWARFRQALVRAKVSSPSIDFCLAGPALYDPLKGQALATVSLQVAARYINMPLGAKLQQAIQYAPVGEAFRKQFLSMISLGALAGAAAVFVVLQLTPAGWALDAAVVIIALATYGPAAFALGEHLGAFFRIADRATSEADLKVAGNHFAQAAALLGTAGLAGLIGKAAGKATAKGVVAQQQRGLGVPTAAQRSLPLWQNQYSAAIKQGLTPQQASLSATMKVQAPTAKPLQPSGNLNAVYEGSRVANRELLPLTDTLARRYGVKFQTRDGLKGEARSAEKVNSEYKGSAAQLLDVAGSRLLFNSLDDLYAALTYIRSKYNVVQIKDRFVEPMATGYRDIVLNIRASNGYVVELRLELSKISGFAATEHKIYQEIRTIRANAALGGRLLTSAEQARVNELISTSKNGYKLIWSQIIEAQK